MLDAPGQAGLVDAPDGAAVDADSVGEAGDQVALVVVHEVFAAGARVGESGAPLVGLFTGAFRLGPVGLELPPVVAVVRRRGHEDPSSLRRRLPGQVFTPRGRRPPGREGSARDRDRGADSSIIPRAQIS